MLTAIKKNKKMGFFIKASSLSFIKASSLSFIFNIKIINIYYFDAHSNTL